MIHSGFYTTKTMCFKLQEHISLTFIYQNKKKVQKPLYHLVNKVSIPVTTTRAKNLGQPSQTPTSFLRKPPCWTVFAVGWRGKYQWVRKEAKHCITTSLLQITFILKYLYLCVYLYWATISHCGHNKKSLIAMSCLLDYRYQGKLHDFVSSPNAGVDTGSEAMCSPRLFYNKSRSFIAHLSEHFRKHKKFLKKMNYLSILCKNLIWNIIKKAINPHLKLIA